MSEGPSPLPTCPALPSPTGTFAAASSGPPASTLASSSQRSPWNPRQVLALLCSEHPRLPLLLEQRPKSSQSPTRLGGGGHSTLSPPSPLTSLSSPIPAHVLSPIFCLTVATLDLLVPNCYALVAFALAVSSGIENSPPSAPRLSPEGPSLLSPSFLSPQALLFSRT